MKTNLLEPHKALSPAYKKFNPQIADIQEFTEKLNDCITAINLVDTKNESEEHLKSPLKKFLNTTFYKDNEINTKDRIDLAVYLGNDTNSDVGIIIEAKKPSNKSEFPTINTLNRKALHEILLYYLRERVDIGNNNIKHLIITNGFEWFFFKASDFYDLFYTDKALLKEYALFRDGLKDSSKNELFYNEIAAKYIEKVEDRLSFVHVDFRKKHVSDYKQKEITNIFKLFSDVHLLGKSFGNDSNQLNKAFYNELLHIIGLEETKENGKKVIKRKAYKTAEYGPLLENTIFTLEDKDYLNKVKNVPAENKAFNVGLELCLTWVNRILFLKLLESQLRSYNGNSKEYKFLNYEFINGFDSLNELFFSALAKPLKERHARYADKFKHIPYLNSSLFEKNALEELTFDITALMDEDMEVYTSTVLKNESGKKLIGKLNTLDYFFKFLDAYDFSADSGIESESQLENKTLINASVLGLIFEKINGYRDGSFYTPGLITMFMCKETLRKSVTQKFREEFEESIETFDDVIDYCKQYFKKEYRKKFNETINSIRICDPAVGSGHFLVSALNEMIAIKSELGILADENYSTLPCSVKVENDEIYILDANDELFSYNRKDPQSLLIQKAIFHEKETVIENCLFGVDINPNSVNICRLRLWIELLKNAYYTDEGELQTLPNIDINIKNGNSLISRFALNDSLKAAFKNKDVSFSVADYKQAVKDYKTTNSKAKKREVEEIITIIKNNFKSTLDNSIRDKVSKAVGLYQNEEQRQQNLIAFGETIKKSEKDNLKKLKQKADLVQKEKEEILNNIIYRNAFEWRFEFPEVLDGDGNFVGFDVIIGNPPYIQLQKMGSASDALQKIGYETYAKTGDIYSLFYELGNNVLKAKGLLTYITSNKWMRAAYGESLRKFFIEKTNPEILIDFGGTQIFDTATVDTNILMFSKDKNRQQTQACIIKDKVLNNLSDYFRQNRILTEFYDWTAWVILLPIELIIKEKIESIGKPLKEWNISINYGIKTGLNEAFIINKEKRNEIISRDPKSAEVIRPILRGRDIKRYSYNFEDLWLINLHNGNKEKHQKAVEINDFPEIKKHLDNFLPLLKKRSDKGDTPYHLRSCAYMEDFFRPKIIFPNMTKFLPFFYDDSQYLTNQKCFIITGENIEFLTAFLNSSIFKFCFRDNFPELQGGTRELSKIFFDKIPVISVTNEINEEFRELVIKVQNLKKHNKITREIELEIDRKIFDLYGLTEREKAEIGFIEIL